MKRKTLLAISSLTLFAFTACRNTDQTNAATTDSSIEQTMTDTSGINRGADPAEFMQSAAVAGIMEIELGKAAIEKAADPKVKKFGEQMVKDHTNIAAELKTLADNKKVKLPTAIPAADQAHITEMKNMSGAAFDKHYLEMVTKAHVKAMDLFKSASVAGDVKIRNFASKTLRILERHFKRAGEISAGTSY